MIDATCHSINSFFFKKTSRQAVCAAGFSLIEVLVAIVVLSIGLLGLAALQAQAVRNSYASFDRSVANLQAQDAVERLWAARCPIQDGSTALTNVRTAWRSTHGSTMPGWTGNITGTEDTTNPTGNYVIRIDWAERSTLRGVEGQTVSFTHHTTIPFINC